MIVPMKRIRIAAPHGRAEEVIALLGRLGVFHVADPGSDPVFMFEDMASGFLSKDTANVLAGAESLIVSISSALNSLPPAPRDKSSFPREENAPFSPALRERITAAVDRITATAAELEKARAERKEARIYRDVFLEFSGLIEVVASSSDVDLVGVSFPQEGSRAMEEMEAALEKATGGVYSIFRPREAKETVVALVVIPISFREIVAQKVFARKIQPIHLPQRFSKGTFASTLASLMERDAELAKTMASLEEELALLAWQWRNNLEKARELLSKTIAPLRAQEKLVYTERIFWISGWVPARETEKLALELDRSFGPEALIFASDPSIAQWEQAPVQLSNPSWVRPFERVVDLYAPPAYGSVDPTIFLAVTFPLFFGMIMGDAGHAIMLALVGAAVARIPGGEETARDVSSIIYRMAGFSLLFGLVYGEFFGDMWSRLGLWQPIFDRKHGASSMLAAVIFLGFFHVAAGAILGAVNAWRRRDWREGAEKGADVFLLAALFWFGAGAAQGAIPNMAGWALGAALALKVAAGWSLKSALEAPKLISNVLSYSRLMALGLASVALADLSNEFMKAPGWWFGGALAGAAFHVLNFVIGVISPAVQTGRLHYVEFFTQFFEPAEQRYKPLTGS